MKPQRPLLALSLLGAALAPFTSSTARAARPVDSALATAQGVHTQNQVRSAGQAPSAEAAPELYPGEDADVGPQFLLMPKARRTFFEAGVDVQYYYTSNTFFTEKGNTDTGVLLSTAWAGFAPPPVELWGGQLALRAGYREQLYNYGLDSTSNQLNNLDFNVGTAYLGARYTFAGSWTASLGFDYNRYLSHDADWTEFYTEALPQWGLEKAFELNDRNVILLGYFGAYHLTFADPSPTTHENDRLDSILLLTSIHQLTEHLVLQPYYRLQHTHYWENGSRNDVFNTFGVALAWVFNEWSSVRLFSSFETRESNDELVSDYHKWDTGGGVSVSLRF